MGVFLVRCGLLPGAATPTARPVLRVCDVAVCGACEVADCRLALGSWLVIASARYLLAPSPLGYRFPNDPRPNHPRWVARCSLSQSGGGHAPTTPMLPVGALLVHDLG